MTESSSNSWLNLNEAAQRLGVHPTTLRRWADEGMLPVLLTAGGHRRFAAKDLDHFIQTHSRNQTTPNPNERWAEHALLQTRKEIVAHPDARWVTAFSAEEREHKRELGRQMMGVLLQYISRDDSAEDLLLEARKLGWAYADNTLRHHMSLTEALQAVFFFRDRLLESVVSLPAHASAPPEANVRLMRRMNEVLNTVQLAIAEAYQTADDAPTLDAPPT